jgi:hypothetical protein
MTNAMTQRQLALENARYRGTGGVSESCSPGFSPAFRDAQTGVVYLSRFADGRPAPFHLLDGLPNELVTARDRDRGGVIAKPSVVSGFVHDGRFYTRDEAAALAATGVSSEREPVSDPCLPRSSVLGRRLSLAVDFWSVFLRASLAGLVTSVVASAIVLVIA